MTIKQGDSSRMSLSQLLYLVPFLCLVFFSAPHLNKTITGDEFDFFSSAEYLAADNSLFYFRAYIDEEVIPQGGEEYQPWVYHPPLYTFSLAGLSKMFGSDVFVYRLFSLFCNLLLLALMPFVLRGLFGKNFPRPAIFAAMMFYASTPLSIHSCLLLDIDNSLLLVFGFALTYLGLQLFKEEKALSLSSAKMLAWIVLFCVLFILSKKTHYPIYFAGPIFSAAFFSKYRKHIPSLIVAFFVSYAVSKGILRVVETIYSIDYSWASSYTSLSDRLYTTFAKFANIRWFILSWFRPIRIAYLGLALPVLVLILPVSLGVRYLSDRRLNRNQPDDNSQDNFRTFALLALYLMSLAVFLVMPGYFTQIPKYQIALLPLLAVVLAVELRKEFTEHGGKVTQLTIVGVFISYLLLGDYLLRVAGNGIWILPYTTWSLIGLVVVPVVLSRFYLVIGWNKALLTGLFISTLSYGFASNLSMLREPGDVVYNYSFDAWPELQEIVAENLEEGSYFLGDPGLGFMAAGDKVIWNWQTIKMKHLSVSDEGMVFVETSPGVKLPVSVFHTWRRRGGKIMYFSHHGYHCKELSVSNVCTRKLGAS